MHGVCAFIRKRAEYGFGSTVSNTELSEFFGAHWVPGSELSEFLSAYYLCVNAKLTEFFPRTHRVCPKTQWVLSSETVLSKQYSARFLFIRPLLRPVSAAPVLPRGIFRDASTPTALSGMNLTSWSSSKASFPRGADQGALKGTELRWERESPKRRFSQKTANFCRFTPSGPSP